MGRIDKSTWLAQVLFEKIGTIYSFLDVDMIFCLNGRDLLIQMGIKCCMIRHQKNANFAPNSNKLGVVSSSSC